MSDLPKSFADHPRSIAEIRSDRSQDAADWTPRDVLIAALRDIDSGLIKPDTLVIVWSKTKGSVSDESYYCASPSPIFTIGTLARVTHKIQTAMDNS